jgi:hypothetical protein
MKKVTALFIMNLVLATSLYAQVKFLAKAGVSWSSVSFNKDINEQFVGDFDYGPKAGFIFGIATEIPLGGDKFSLQPELLFHQKGYTSKYIDSESSSSFTHTLNYLELPVLARVNFGKFYATTGTYVGFGVGGNYKGSITSTSIGFTTEWEGDVKFGAEPDNYAGSNQYINAVDFGVQFGAGMNVGLVVIDLRFGLGLTDIVDKGDLSTQTLNRSLQLTAGFPLVAKKK